VTLEDLFEKLVGEIDDERDRLVLTGLGGAGERRAQRER